MSTELNIATAIARYMQAQVRYSRELRKLIETDMDQADSVAVSTQRMSATFLWDLTAGQSPGTIHKALMLLGTDNALQGVRLLASPLNVEVPYDNHALCSAMVKLIFPQENFSDIDLYVDQQSASDRQTPERLATNLLMRNLISTMAAKPYDHAAFRALTLPTFLLPGFNFLYQWWNRPGDISIDRTERMQTALYIAEDIVDTFEKDDSKNWSAEQQEKMACYAGMAQHFLADALRKPTIGTAPDGLNFLHLGSLHALLERNALITEAILKNKKELDADQLQQKEIAEKMKKILPHPALQHPLLENPRETAFVMMQKRNYGIIRNLVQGKLGNSQAMKAVPSVS